MKTVKLIALDLDGTLIPESQRVSLKDAHAVRRAQAAGIPVVIATGRLYPSARVWLSALDIHTPAVCCNGADIREGARSVYSSTIDPAQLKEAYRALCGFRAKKYVYCVDNIYCSKEDFDAVLFHKWGKKELARGLVGYRDGPDEILGAAGSSAVKLVMRTPDEKEHAKIEEIAGAMEYFDVVKAEATHIEFTRRGTNKGAALKRIAAGMGIAMRDVLAVGDSMNDYEMLRAAGTGVAMGNAMREIKNIADDITLPVWESGVAHAISRHVFGEDAAFEAVLGTE
jgi:hypothetical protein